MLDFVSDGLKFDSSVVKIKAAHTLPYSSKNVEEIFEKKTLLGDNLKIEPGRFSRGFKYLNLVQVKKEKKPELSGYQQLAICDEEQDKATYQAIPITESKFKLKHVFEDTSKLFSSDTELNNVHKSKQNYDQAKMVMSLDDQHDFFLTETRFGNEITTKTKSGVKSQPLFGTKKKKGRNSVRDELKELNNVNWDEYVIDLLSENTARWIVVKGITDRKPLSI